MSSVFTARPLSINPSEIDRAARGWRGPLQGAGRSGRLRFQGRRYEEGGQGAPLVPIFHRALAFREKLELPAAFVNIGGIANVTYVPDGPAEGLIAFDAGAGNCLLDDWAMKHIGEPLGPGLALGFGRDGEAASACGAPVASLFRRAAAKMAGSGRLSFGCAR